MRITRQQIEEAARALGPMESDEPTEEQFDAFRRWADDQELGPATAMEVYEQAVLLCRSRRQPDLIAMWCESASRDRKRRNG